MWDRGDMHDQLILSQLRVQGLLDDDTRDESVSEPPAHHTLPSTDRSALAIVHDPPVPTPLDLDLELHVDLEMAGRTNDPTQTVDLAQIVAVVKAIAEHGHWGLLESLALAIARTLLLPPAPGENRAGVEALTIRIRKPAWTRAHATPGVVLHRPKRWCATERRVLGPGVAADIIAETRSTELMRVRLTPGARWTLPPGACTVSLGQVEVRGERVSAKAAPGALLVVHRK
jgi:dihydroneopterin aldolase